MNEDSSWGRPLFTVDIDIIRGSATVLVWWEKYSVQKPDTHSNTRWHNLDVRHLLLPGVKWFILTPFNYMLKTRGDIYLFIYFLSSWISFTRKLQWHRQVRPSEQETKIWCFSYAKWDTSCVIHWLQVISNILWKASSTLASKSLALSYLSNSVC